MRIKIFSSLLLVLVATLLVPAAHVSAASSVYYNPDSKELIINGDCSGDTANIVMYKRATNTGWGSFSAPCVNNQFSLTEKMTEWKIDEGQYDVKIVDNAAQKKNNGKFFNFGNNDNRVTVNITNLVPPAPESPLSQVSTSSDTTTTPPAGFTGVGSLSTSTEQAIADQQSLLEQLFGVFKAIEESIVRVTTLFAESVRTTLISTVQFFSKNITVLPEGSVTLPSGTNQITGHAEIPADADHIFISNTQVTVDSRIILTPLHNIIAPLAVTNKIAGQGFEVSIVAPLKEPLPFDWVLFQTYSAGGEVYTIPVNLPAQNAVPDQNNQVNTSTPPTDATVSDGTSTTPDAVVQSPVPVEEGGNSPSAPGEQSNSSTPAQ